MADMRVVITGGVSVIGEAFARRFVGDGARVAVLDIDRRTLAALQEALPDLDLAAEVDVSDRSRVEEVFADLDRPWGGVDALFSNAGIMLFEPFLEAHPTGWEHVLAVKSDRSFPCGSGGCTPHGIGWRRRHHLRCFRQRDGWHAAALTAGREVARLVAELREENERLRAENAEQAAELGKLRADLTVRCSGCRRSGRARGRRAVPAMLPTGRAAGLARGGSAARRRRSVGACDTACLVMDPTRSGAALARHAGIDEDTGQLTWPRRAPRLPDDRPR
jgi:hypothetical protein